MIPRVQGHFDQKIHFDNTLFSLSVPPVETNATKDQVLTWLLGISQANELFLDLQDDVIVLKGTDFARHSVLLQGKLEDEFLTTAKSMGWDVLPIAGSYVIEYPVAHQKVIQTLMQIERTPVSFLMNISILDQADRKAAGIRVDDFISFSLSNFDILHYKQPIANLQLPGISLQKDQIKFVQDNTYTLVLSTIVGEPVSQRIDKQKSVITTSRDALGQTVSQQVQTFTAGFIANLNTYPHHKGILTQLDLEISQDLSTNESDIPEIARKSIRNGFVLESGQTWLAGKFEAQSTDEDNRKKFFLPFSKRFSSKQVMIVVIKRTL